MAFFCEVVELPRLLTAPELLAALPGGPGRVLLESGGSGGAPPEVCRWSFATAAPVGVLTSGTGGATRGLFRHLVGGRCRDRDTDPFALLDRTLARLEQVARAGTPDTLPPEAPPFPAGVAGYLAYDLNRYVEALPGRALPEVAVPDLFLGVYDLVAALDHREGRLWLTGIFPPGQEGLLRERARRWRERLEQAARRPGSGRPACPAPAGPAAASLPPREYLQAVERALTYIREGEIFQVNLARRFRAPLHPAWGLLPGWRVYQRLREVSPAPFAAYLQGPGFEIASSSPERFLAVWPEGHGGGRDRGGGDRGAGGGTGGGGLRRVQTRPIKGTRPRGNTPEEDRARAAELLASEKDRAELTMIVDLSRNDLGRVARTGSVRVADLRRLESYAAVHHTVGVVEALLEPGVSAGALLRAAFPAGSVTGAPKVRAMEIVDELEPVRRHVFCGSIGYFAVTGGLDLNVAIRTVTVSGGRAFFHAGGGIVADSDPRAELEETRAKARGMAAALGVAVDGGEAGGEEGLAGCTSG